MHFNISFIHCLLNKIAYVDTFIGFNCNFCINYKAYIFLSLQLCSTMVQLEFGYFHTFDLDRPIWQRRPYGNMFESHSISCRVITRIPDPKKTSREVGNPYYLGCPSHYRD